MEPYTRNGSIIGKKLNYSSTTQVSIGQSSETITYVGGHAYSGLGTTNPITVSLTSLTGGGITSPQPGDIVIVAAAIASVANAAYSFRLSGYTQITNLFANDSVDINLQIGYKVMGATPDSTVTITGGSGSTANGIAVVVHVWRGVDTTNPLDVAVVTKTAINTGIPTFNSITPVTPGAVLVFAGSSGHTGAVDTYSAPYLSNFRTIGSSDTYDPSVGIGSIPWNGSGSYSGAAWGWTQTDSASYSMASAVIALKPATVELFKDKTQSGIWDLATTSTAPDIAGNNVFPNPRDIYEWCKLATTNNCTISKDTTMSSPFSNTPLKMYITGASDPWIGTVSIPTYNIASAAVGQTWEVSVWAMTDLATSGEIYLFESNSSSVWTSQSNLTLNLKPYWQQFKLRRTFTDATTSFVQIRLDGQHANGVGSSIWFDGLQVRRII